MHGLRHEYQDRVNFVILDFDVAADRALAGDLGVARHPAYGVVAPDSDDVMARVFGAQDEAALRHLLDAAAGG